MKITNVNDFSKFFVGIDEFISSLTENVSTSSYPPHNVIKIMNGYLIEMAVAGFKKENLSVIMEDDVLKVSGEIDEKSFNDKDYVFRSLSRRSFKKDFRLNQNLELSGAELKDGILSIYTECVLPEKVTTKVEIK